MGLAWEADTRWRVGTVETIGLACWKWAARLEPGKGRESLGMLSMTVLAVGRVIGGELTA